MKGDPHYDQNSGFYKVKHLGPQEDGSGAESSCCRPLVGVIHEKVGNMVITRSETAMLGNENPARVCCWQTCFYLAQASRGK